MGRTAETPLNSRFALPIDLALLVGCGAACPRPTPATDAELAAVLDDWHDAAAHSDEERYSGT